MGFVSGRVVCLFIYSHLDSFRVLFSVLGFWYILGRSGSVVGGYQKQEQATDPRSQLRGSSDPRTTVLRKSKNIGSQAGNRNRGSQKLGKDQETAGSYQRSVRS